MAISQIEKACLDTVESNINMAVPWYIMACYAYYVEDDPLLEDAMFDRLANKIIDNWDTIDHFHKDYLTLDMLKAGTYLGDYPLRVQGAVKDVRQIRR